MIRLARFAALVSIVSVWSCGRPAPQTRRLDRVTFTAAESAFYLGADEACGFVPRKLNPQPTALVREYNRRDNEGQFLGRNTWLDSAYDCPEHLPGPDAFTVVSSTEIVAQTLTDSLARIMVSSVVLGYMEADSVGPVFEPRPSTKTDTFVVINTPYGWRIRSPQLPDNVLASWVLSQPQKIRLRPGNRDTLLHATRRVSANER